jgi:hypothetical protein
MTTAAAFPWGSFHCDLTIVTRMGPHLTNALPPPSAPETEPLLIFECIDLDIRDMSSAGQERVLIKRLSKLQGW